MKLRTVIGLPFTLLFGGATAVRNVLYDRGVFKSSEFDLPLINVGNLRVGGSGKSPHIEYLIRLLSDEAEFAVLSRGYGRKTRGFREVTGKDTALEAGDEPLQFKTRFPDTQVFVGENRVNAVIEILSEHDTIDGILLDDAYQHRSIRPGFNILVSDYAHLFTHDFVMPAGDLRERRAGAKRADAVVVSKCLLHLSEEKKQGIRTAIAKYTDADVFFSGITYGKIFRLSNASEEELKQERVLFVSGIAKAQPAVDYLESLFPHVDHLAYRDHYNYTQKDIDTILDHAKSFGLQNVLTTYKDAMRLKALWKDEYPALFVLPIQVVFLENDKNNFDQKIKSYVAANKRDERVHQ